MSRVDAAQRPDENPDAVPERFVPDRMRGQLAEAEHIARYEWASTFCSGKRVIDVGCGAGYGAEMLRRAGASEVVAVDISPAALELARATVNDGVRLELGDVRSLAFEDDAFDLVVCFEVLEHVDEQDQTLDELARICDSEGLLLISSPNRDRYVPGNPHHRHEFSRPELQTALDARFPAARIVSQHVMIASVISWTGSPLFGTARVQRMVDPEPDDEIYLLAMAGAELPPDPDPVVTLGLFSEARRWLAHIEAQKRYIDDQTAQLEDLTAREAERMQALRRVAELEQRLAELATTQRADAELAREELSAAQEELRSVREQDDARSHELAQLRTVATSKSWQLTAPVRRLARVLRRLRGPGP